MVRDRDKLLIGALKRLVNRDNLCFHRFGPLVEGVERIKCFIYPLRGLFASITHYNMLISFNSVSLRKSHTRADSGSSELLCHHGQLRELSAVLASDASGAVQMAESAEPTQVIYLGGLPTSPEACRLAPGESASQSEPFCTAEWLNEEPDMGKPFVRFCEGWRHNRCRAEILWHRRETRRQTENTNIMPIARKASFYSTKTHAASRS